MIYAYSIDTLGLPLGASKLQFNFETDGAIHSPTKLFATSDQLLAQGGNGKWTTFTDGTNSGFLLRDGDFFYLVMDWKPAVVPLGTATQNGKKTFMSKASFVELFPMVDSLTSVQNQVNAFKRAFAWMDAT